MCPHTFGCAQPAEQTVRAAPELSEGLAVTSGRVRGRIEPVEARAQ